MKLVLKINKKQAQQIIQSVPTGSKLTIKGDAWNYIFDLKNKKKSN